MAILIANRGDGEANGSCGYGVSYGVRQFSLISRRAINLTEDLLA